MVPTWYMLRKIEIGHPLAENGARWAGRAHTTHVQVRLCDGAAPSMLQVSGPPHAQMFRMVLDAAGFQTTYLDESGRTRLIFRGAGGRSMQEPSS